MSAVISTMRVHPRAHIDTRVDYSQGDKSRDATGETDDSGATKR